MSQRVNGFKGGIPLGGNATTEESSKLDKLVSRTSRKLGEEFAWRKRYSGQDLQTKYDTIQPLSGAMPDGGIFLDSNGNPLLVVEAKRQGAVGNAIERWFKNYHLFKTMGCGIYLTFCTGEGFFNGCSAQTILNTHQAQQGITTDHWNTQHEGDSWFYRYNNVDDLNEDVVAEVIREALTEAHTRSAN